MTWRVYHDLFSRSYLQLKRGRDGLSDENAKKNVDDAASCLCVIFVVVSGMRLLWWPEYIVADILLVMFDKNIDTLFTYFQTYVDVLGAAVTCNVATIWVGGNYVRPLNMLLEMAMSVLNKKQLEKVLFAQSGHSKNTFLFMQLLGLTLIEMGDFRAFQPLSPAGHSGGGWWAVALQYHASIVACAGTLVPYIVLTRADKSLTSHSESTMSVFMPSMMNPCMLLLLIWIGNVRDFDFDGGWGWVMIAAEHTRTTAMAVCILQLTCSAVHTYIKLKTVALLCHLLIAICWWTVTEQTRVSIVVSAEFFLRTGISAVMGWVSLHAHVVSVRFADFVVRLTTGHDDGGRMIMDTMKAHVDENMWSFVPGSLAPVIGCLAGFGIVAFVRNIARNIVAAFNRAFNWTPKRSDNKTARACLVLAAQRSGLWVVHWWRCIFDQSFRVNDKLKRSRSGACLVLAAQCSGLWVVHWWRCIFDQSFRVNDKLKRSKSAKVDKAAPTLLDQLLTGIRVFCTSSGVTFVGATIICAASLPFHVFPRNPSDIPYFWSLTLGLALWELGLKWDEAEGKLKVRRAMQKNGYKRGMREALKLERTVDELQEAKDRLLRQSTATKEKLSNLSWYASWFTSEASQLQSQVNQAEENVRKIENLIKSREDNKEKEVKERTKKELLTNAASLVFSVQENVSVLKLLLRVACMGGCLVLLWLNEAKQLEAWKNFLSFWG